MSDQNEKPEQTVKPHIPAYFILDDDELKKGIKTIDPVKVSYVNERLRLDPVGFADRIKETESFIVIINNLQNYINWIINVILFVLIVFIFIISWFHEEVYHILALKAGDI